MYSPVFSILKGTHIEYEKDTYYWMMFFSAFYIVHLLLTTQNRNYLSVYILVLGLIILDVYNATHERYAKNEESVENFLETLIAEAREQDKNAGEKVSKYKFAKALLKSDPILLSWLRKFKRLGENQQESFDLISSSILRFYQAYGVMLRIEKKVRDMKVSLQDLIVMRQSIMNLVHQFGIQIIHVKAIDKEIQQFGLIVLSSLNRCLKVVRNKYQLFETYAPYAHNLSGDVHEMY